MSGFHSPVPTTARGIIRASQGRSDHDGIRPAGNCLDDRSAGTHSSVSDHMDVPAAGLVEVVTTSGRNVGNRRCHRDPNTEHIMSRVCSASAEPNQDTRCACTHQMQGRAISRAAANDHRHIEFEDELLEVQRLTRGRSKG